MGGTSETSRRRFQQCAPLSVREAALRHIPLVIVYHKIMGYVKRGFKCKVQNAKCKIIDKNGSGYRRDTAEPCPFFVSD